MAYRDSKLYKRTYQRARRSGLSRKRAKNSAKCAVYRSRSRRGWELW